MIADAVSRSRLYAMTDSAAALDLARAAARDTAAYLRTVRERAPSNELEADVQRADEKRLGRKLRSLLSARRLLHRYGARSSRPEALPADFTGQWLEAENPYHPALDSHGVYVAIGHHYGRGLPYCEVQILAADRERSQWSTVRTFATKAEALNFAARMLRAGEALADVVASEHRFEIARRAER